MLILDVQGFNSVVAQTVIRSSSGQGLWWSKRSETTFEGNKSLKSAFNWRFKSLALPKAAFHFKPQQASSLFYFCCDWLKVYFEYVPHAVGKEDFMFVVGRKASLLLS